jgi:hypothetical protein
LLAISAWPSVEKILSISLLVANSSNKIVLVKSCANWKDHYWEWQAKCRENNWSGTFFGKDCPDTSWKKNEKKRGDYQSILDADGI